MKNHSAQRIQGRVMVKLFIHDTRMSSTVFQDFLDKAMFYKRH